MPKDEVQLALSLEEIEKKPVKREMSQSSVALKEEISELQNRKKALEAMKRFFKKNGEPEPPVGPEPPEEPLVTAFQYNRITSPKICEYRRLRYGSSLPPSDSAYMSLFGGFEEEWPWVDVTQFYKSQIEQRQDNNFIILELLHLLEYEPVYDENNRCIGLTDFTGGNPYVS